MCIAHPVENCETIRAACACQLYGLEPRMAPCTRTTLPPADLLLGAVPALVQKRPLVLGSPPAGRQTCCCRPPGSCSVRHGTQLVPAESRMRQQRISLSVAQGAGAGSNRNSAPLPETSGRRARDPHVHPVPSGVFADSSPPLLPGVVGSTHHHLSSFCRNRDRGLIDPFQISPVFANKN
jgi:hypothetical protein